MQAARQKTASLFARTVPAFTVVEILLVIVTIAVLAVITVVSYNGVQHRSADSLTQRTVADGIKTLQVYYVFNKNYPSNIANTEYASPQTVAVALYTDAGQTPVYPISNPDENAQLFINTCSSISMAVTTIHYTGCTYDGNNAHVAGTESANVVIPGPTIQQSDFNLLCSSTVSPDDCVHAQADIMSVFLAQGGHFPIEVPKKASTLPAPTMTTTGVASTYCLQASSGRFTDIIYHAVPTSSAPEPGPCPASLGLHYP